MSVHKPIPKRHLGAPKFPHEVGGKDLGDDYRPSEAVTRPMTEEEKIKYGVDSAITPEKICELLDQGCKNYSQIAEQLNTTVKTVVSVMARNGISNQDYQVISKEKEDTMVSENAEKDKKRLSIDDIEKLLEDGMTLQQIGEKHYPKKPGNIRSIVGKLKPELLEKYDSGNDSNVTAQRKKKQIEAESKDNKEIFHVLIERILKLRGDMASIQEQVQELSKKLESLEGREVKGEVLEIEEADNFRGQFIELGKFLACHPNATNDAITNEDNDILIALEGMLHWLMGGSEIADIEKVLETQARLINELRRQALNHRHMIGPGHYSEVPAIEVGEKASK